MSTRATRLRQPLVIALLAGLVLAVAGCGGSETSPEGSPGDDAAVAGPDLTDADAGDAEVIAAWADALREGDVEAAADRFALPSVAENGPQLIAIETPEDAIAFNDSLPCGAILVRAVTQGEFTTATFELTDRPGGNCGPGTGERAQTAFTIEDGKITEWRRVGGGNRSRGRVI